MSSISVVTSIFILIAGIGIGGVAARLYLKPGAAKKSPYHLQAPVIATDMQDRVTQWSPGAEALYGYSANEALGKVLYDLILPDIRDVAAIQAALRAGGIWQGRVQRLAKNGQPRSIEVTLYPSLDDSGVHVGRVAISREVTERDQIEEALRQSEKRFSTIFHISPIAITISRISDKSYVDVNDAFLALYGFSRAEVLNGTVRANTLWSNPEQRAEYERLRQEQGGVRQFEFTFIKPSGEIGTGLLSSERIELDGELCSITFTLDITERKQTEQVLRQSQDHLRSLHEVSIRLNEANSVDELCRLAIELGLSQLGFERLGLWLINEGTDIMTGAYGTSADGQVQDEKYLQTRISDDPMAAETLINKSLISIWEDTPLFDDWDIVGSGWNMMAVLWDGDKGIGWLAADNLIHKKPLLPHQPELLQLYSVALGHLLARKKTEEQLKLSEERFAKIFQVSPIPISISSVDAGNYVAVNDSWVKLFGYSREETIGHTGGELNIWPDEQALMRLNTALKQQSLVPDREITVNTKTGTVLSVMWSALLINLDQGPVILSMLYDITERKEAEQQRLLLALATEKVQVLTEFLGNISHDLKTPLTVINTSLYLLDHLTDPTRQQDQLKKIKEQTLMLEKYIQDILIITRLDHTRTLSQESVNLNDLIQKIEGELRPSAERKHLKTTLNLDKDMPSVLGDVDELHSAIVNLVENAFNYTPEGGSVAIDTFVREHQAVTKVSDTGIGIEQTELPYIFERFYRSDAAKATLKTGSGLGLAIVKRVIDLHHGTIRVESHPGAGTTFEVHLPVE